MSQSVLPVNCDCLLVQSFEILLRLGIVEQVKWVSKPIQHTNIAYLKKPGLARLISRGRGEDIPSMVVDWVSRQVTDHYEER